MLMLIVGILKPMRRGSVFNMKALIVGAGKLGGKLASQLSGGDTLVTVMDSDPEVLERIADHLDVMIVKAAECTWRLLKVNIEEYDLVIAVTESDETNMVICSIAKKLGCKKA